MDYQARRPYFLEKLRLKLINILLYKMKGTYIFTNYKNLYDAFDYVWKKAITENRSVEPREAIQYRSENTVGDYIMIALGFTNERIEKMKGGE